MLGHAVMIINSHVGVIRMLWEPLIETFTQLAENMSEHELSSWISTQGNLPVERNGTYEFPRKAFRGPISTQF